ncbi:MAG: type II toxin-antitoxin system Phd/YefM family antitoxin [Spirochaetia bacterium]|jgi:prevent-host-death family protein
MAAQLDDFGHPTVLPTVSTNELRDNLAQAINRAAYGREPVLVTRRGRKIAAIISIVDLEFLETMKQRRDEAMTERLPADQSGIGAVMARRLYRELFFG